MEINACEYILRSIWRNFIDFYQLFFKKIALCIFDVEKKRKKNFFVYTVGNIWLYREYLNEGV